MDNQQVSLKEEWKVIKEFPRYEVSNTWIIRDVTTKRVKYTNKAHKAGYEIVQFKKAGKVYSRKVHRLVAIAFLPPPSDELIQACSTRRDGQVVLVNHKDGNKLNNHVSNLEWCDDAYNAKHASLTGLNPAPKGENNGRSVLTDEIVHSVCKAFEDGMTPKQATEEFSISMQQATKIRAKIAWTHISAQYDIKPLRVRKTSTTRA